NCGTPRYAAPEIRTTPYYDATAADVWSVGVVTHCLLNGAFPFGGCGPLWNEPVANHDSASGTFLDRLLAQQLSGVIEFRNESLSAPAREFIRRHLNPKCSLRP